MGDWWFSQEYYVMRGSGSTDSVFSYADVTEGAL